MPWLTNVEPALARTWLPVAMSSEITAEPTRVWLLGSPYVACRLGDRLTVLPDRCPHRLAPLSGDGRERPPAVRLSRVVL